MLAIKDHMNQWGEKPSVEAVAKQSQMSYGMIQRDVMELENMDWIAVDRSDRMHWKLYLTTKAESVIPRLRELQ